MLHFLRKFLQKMADSYRSSQLIRHLMHIISPFAMKLLPDFLIKSLFLKHPSRAERSLQHNLQMILEKRFLQSLVIFFAQQAKDVIISLIVAKLFVPFNRLIFLKKKWKSSKISALIILFPKKKNRKKFLQKILNPKLQN